MLQRKHSMCHRRPAGEREVRLAGCFEIRVVRARLTEFEGFAFFEYLCSRVSTPVTLHDRAVACWASYVSASFARISHLIRVQRRVGVARRLLQSGHGHRSVSVPQCIHPMAQVSLRSMTEQCGRRLRMMQRYGGGCGSGAWAALSFVVSMSPKSKKRGSEGRGYVRPTLQPQREERSKQKGWAAFEGGERGKDTRRNEGSAVARLVWSMKKRGTGSRL